MSDWIITYGGRDHFISGPEAAANDIDIRDVAHSLATLNRYTGHARRPISVAEHSLLCADLAKHDGHSTLIQLLCLMHDGHESITGDASSPVKKVLGPAWTEFEQLVARRFRAHFGLTVGFTAYRKLVNHFDIVALATERRDLTAYAEGRNLAWGVLDTPGQEVPPASWVDLNECERVSRPWQEWRDAFLTRYFELARQAQPAAEHLQSLPFNA